MIIHSQSDGASSENSETSWENAIKQAFKPVQSRSKLTWMTDYVLLISASSSLSGINVSLAFLVQSIMSLRLIYRSIDGDV